ncbi:hypothetical protein HDIA_0714 [Hartmannibacter diazotrophicus]|uniref:Uncharacterized protein n=1 Tax=Hartmannibacter diazotrophicus TaxID=1482074 RepID=A0A2C9D447_9HYPH|nr:hypothetical protein HDIA_0714 [Hartmannibacter diazotrophicus]
MELLMIVCLLATPAHCRSESLTVSIEEAPPMQCMMTAQQTIAQWTAAHPKWQVARWRCVPSKRKGFHNI